MRYDSITIEGGQLIFSTDEDSQFDREINIRLKTRDNDFCFVVLRQLWGEEDNCNSDEPFEECFSKGDYFQQNFQSSRQRVGLGSKLHDALIQNKETIYNKFELKRIFSTLEEEDDTDLSPSAEAFWKKRVDENKAVYNTKFRRYMLQLGM